MGFSVMRYQNMRNELIGYLKGLSDREYQKRCWVLKNCPNGVENDELDYVVHFLFDDTQLGTNPESLIGYILKDDVEVEAIKSICYELDSIFEKYGYDLSDDDYINLPEWTNVIKKAENALGAIKKNA